MGYFSNGTEGMHYETRYCEQCVHYGDEDKGCPVMGLHTDWNYEQFGAVGAPFVKRYALDTFIPRDDEDEGDNEACTMFHPIDHEPPIDPNQYPLFEEETS